MAHNGLLAECPVGVNDSLKGFGLTTKHIYSVTRREFSETNKIFNANYDSTQTHDQYRLAGISNGAGIYIKSTKLCFDILIQHKYWDYQNLGTHKDTSEVNLTSSIEYNTRNIRFKNDLNSNLIGAGGEWSNKAMLNLNTRRLNYKISF